MSNNTLISPEKLRVLASRFAVNTSGGLKLRARVERDRIVFFGGEREVSHSASTAKALETLWIVYCEINGAKAHPAVGARVRFRRGMFGWWDGRVVSSCPTSAMIEFKRKNGTSTQRRVDIVDVFFE